MRRFYIQLIVDIAIGLLVFLFSLWLHTQAISSEIEKYLVPALLFYGFHYLISLVSRKYENGKKHNFRTFYRLWYRSWIYTAGLSLLVIYTLQFAYFSRTIILTNIFGLFTGEFIFLSFVYVFRKSVRFRDREEIAEEEVIRTERPLVAPHLMMITPEPETVRANIAGEAGSEALDFIEKHIDLQSGSTLVVQSTSVFNILNQPSGYFRQIVNLARFNDIIDINRFFEAVNNRLPVGGVMLICGETKNLRKTRIMKKFAAPFNYIFYFFDFFLMRVAPKFPVTRNIYMAFTKGIGQVISRAEILGRIISCGFAIAEEQKINGMFYVAARKTGDPFRDEHPTYGLIINLNRVGKSGKMIRVYKLRTMHPYSEYIQEYVYDKNDLLESGKINGDFRITTEGKLFRKFWLDELPMLYNMLRGDLKLVGVRPLSKHFLSLYRPAMQEKHVKFKPGLIPPFYADLPKNLDEIQDSEERYLDAYEKAHFRTDVRYFFLAMKNIIFKHARSS